MFAPEIDSSTREERLAYVQDRWQCRCSCELCGKCAMLKGRDAEIVLHVGELVDDIGAGESVRQAFLNFCKEIILNAK